LRGKAEWAHVRCLYEMHVIFLKVEFKCCCFEMNAILLSVIYIFVNISVMETMNVVEGVTEFAIENLHANVLSDAAHIQTLHEDFQLQIQTLENEVEQLKVENRKLATVKNELLERNNKVDQFLSPSSYELCGEGNEIFQLHKKGLKNGNLVQLRNIMRLVELEYVVTTQFKASVVAEGPKRMKERKMKSMTKSFTQINKLLVALKESACVNAEKKTISKLRGDMSNLEVSRLISTTACFSARSMNMLNDLTDMTGHNGCKPVASASGIARVYRQLEAVAQHRLKGHVNNKGRTANIPLAKFLDLFIEQVLIPGGWDHKQQYNFHWGLDGVRESQQNTIILSLRMGKDQNQNMVAPLLDLKAHSLRQILPVAMAFECETKDNTETLCRPSFDLSRSINRNGGHMFKGVMWNRSFFGSFDMKCIWAVEDDGAGSHGCQHMNCCPWNHTMGVNELRPMCKQCQRRHDDPTTNWKCQNDGQCTHWDSCYDVKTPPPLSWPAVSDTIHIIAKNTHTTYDVPLDFKYCILKDGSLMP